jgi:hypothetical protein
MAEIAASVGETGFWDNIVVRPHPENPGHYQLCYGHNRMAVLGCPNIPGHAAELLQEEAELSVADFTDYQMLQMMVRENSAQRKVTDAQIAENVYSAARLAESLLKSCETYEEYQAALFGKNSQPTAQLAGQKQQKTRLDDFTKLKEAIAPDGIGLGQDFIRQFLGGASGHGSNVIQQHLNYYYADRLAASARKAERKRKQQEAEAKRRREEAERKQREAEEEQRKQEEARRKAEAEARAASEQRERARAQARAQRAQRKADEAAKKADRQRKEQERREAEEERARKQAERDKARLKKRTIPEQFRLAQSLRNRLESPTRATMLQDAIVEFEIPIKYHEELVDDCLAGGWVARTNYALGQTSPIIRDGVRKWWDAVSGNRKQRRDRASEQAKLRAKMKRAFSGKHNDSLDEFVRILTFNQLGVIEKMEAVLEYVESIEDPDKSNRYLEATRALHSLCGATISAMTKPNLKLVNDDD